MLKVECPRCKKLQTIKKKVCQACGQNLARQKLTYVTRVCYKKQNGNYGYIQTRHPGKSLEDVKRFEFEQRQKLKQSREEDSYIWLSQVFKTYCDWMAIKNPNWAHECVRMSRDMLQLLGDMPASKLRRARVLALRNEIKARPHLRTGKEISNRTVNAYMAVGRAAYNYIDPGGYNPFRALGKLPEPKVIEYLTEEEEERLLSVAKTRFPLVWRFIVVSLGTGFRKSAVLNLRRSQVDFINKKITIVQKGGRVHTIVLLDTVEAILKSIPDDGTDYFFFNPKTGRPYQDLRNGFNQCLALAGINKPFRRHGLRHHVAYKLLKAQRNLKLVQDVLGHSQIQTTTRYLSMLPEDYREQMKCLELPSAISTNSTERPKLRVVSEK